MASAAPPQYSYTPPTPSELSYYNALFAIADKSSAGYLSGPSAVEFFLLSKLPLELLKTIWTMADQPTTNTLDSKKFYVAVRLIQLFQNGKKPVDLALNVMMEAGSVGGATGMKPPYFEGVEVLPPPPQPTNNNNLGQTASSFPMQQPPQQQQQQQSFFSSPQLQPMVAASSSSQRSPVPPPMASNFSLGGSAAVRRPLPTTTSANTTTTTTLAIQDPYTMTPQELSRYDALFPMYATQDSTEDGKMYVHGPTAVELFCKSGMDRESLKGIWTMVDDPIDNKLDSVEFAVAMHLIVCVTKKGLPTPLTLPSSLANLVQYARSQGQQQQQTSAIGGGGGGGGQSVMGVSGGSVTPQRSPPRGGGGGGGGVGGGIPTPDNQGGLQQQFQQPQMNGGMSYSPQLPQYQQQTQQQHQQPPLQQPQMMMQPQTQQGAQQQPWSAQPQVDVPYPAAGMQQQQGVPQTGSFGMQPTGVPQTSSFGGSGAAAVGKLSINDAFAGLSNDPVADVDEYSTIGSEAGRDVIGRGEVATMQSVPTWEMSPRPPLLPSLQQHQLQGQLGQSRFHQQHEHEPLPPRSPRIPPNSPRSSRNTAPSTVISSEGSGAELISLREAHQKLQAEVISLRAKAASVTDEEMQVQKEIKSVASEIGKLSLELSTLKESVMEAKMKLGESVGVLKVQMGKKEYLEAQVAEARMTHEALNSAAVAVEEANELAMTMKARAVAAGAAYKDDEADTAPAPVASQETPAETADLFSWDAPSDVSPSPSIQVGATSSSLAQEYPNQSSPFHFGSSDNTASGPSTGWVQPALSMEEKDSYSMYSNPKVNGNYGDVGMGAPMGGGGGVSSLDIMGAPMGGGLTPMGQSVSGSIGFDSQSEKISAGVIDNTTLQPSHPTKNGTSPSEADLNFIKSKTAEAERTFRDCTDLVRKLSSEVVKLESSVKDADADVSALEGKTKKSSTFGGKKKKVKAEYDKAVEWAQMERSKLEEAKKKLVIAEREAADAEREMEKMRQKCEELEMEAATAASYWSAQQEHDGGQEKQIGGYQQPKNHFANSFGVGSINHETPSADPYGMGFMGGASSSNDDYDNPFAM